MATKRFRNWFFQVTSVLRRDGTTGGIRFLTKDKPTQGTMEDFSESIAFMKESSDRAKPYTGATDLGTEQGLSVLATDAQAKSNAAQLADRSLVTQPHQLPTAENLDADAFEDMEVQTLDITAEAGTTTRNRYQFRLNLDWLTWLFTRIFKQGGVEGDVPLKNSGINYDWNYGNVGDNTTTVNKIANNSNFINALLANSTFIDSITTTIINSNPTAIIDSLPVGSVQLVSHVGVFSGNPKWILPVGQELAIVDYPDLYALYSNFYDTKNGQPAPAVGNFRVPDYRDRTVRQSFLLGVGDHGGADTFQINANNLPLLTVSGSVSGTTDNDGSHQHNVLISTGGPLAGTEDSLNCLPTADNADVTQAGITGIGEGAHQHNFSASLSGGTVDGTGAHNAINNNDPYIPQIYYIKALK